jgi:hypothetical protein
LRYLQKVQGLNKNRLGDITRILRNAASALTAFAALSGCAVIGNPDGGPYDETPPKITSSHPENGATGVKTRKVSIDFNEFIKLENANENVVISPPQKEQPEIKVTGKKIQVELFDSLKPNTTYSIDFADGIVDNEAGKPDVQADGEVANRPYQLLVDDLFSVTPGTDTADGAAALVTLNFFGSFAVTNPSVCGVLKFYNV